MGRFTHTHQADQASPKAIIIGGGIAGLSAGVALRKANYRVTLYEQAEKIEPLGAALSIWGNAMAGLDWLGCGADVRQNSAQLTSVALRNLAGRSLFGPVDIGDSHSYLPMRAHLQSVLLGKFGVENCQLGMQFVSATQDGTQVTARFKNGNTAQADLLVIADGIYSKTATKYLNNPPHYCGYAGVLGIAEAIHLEGGKGDFPSQYSEEIWGKRERFGLFSAGRNRMYWFYMASATEAEAANTPPLKAIQSKAHQWPEIYQKAVASTHENSIIPIAIHARSAPKKLGEKRIICIGDAAHAMEPNQGQGACQGIEDAWALGVLAQSVVPQEILPKFEQMRLKRIQRAMRDSHLIGRAAHSSSKWERNISRKLLAWVPAMMDRHQLRTRILPAKMTCP